ncbi:MAG: GNAT family N-acetyltransferase [Cyanobacteria bacterium J06638_22]
MKILVKWQNKSIDRTVIRLSEIKENLPLQSETTNTPNPGAVQIRHWQPDDRSAILALHEELQAYERNIRSYRSAKPGLSEEYIKEFDEQLEDPDCDAAFFVAEANGKVIGFAFCVAEGDILDDPPEQVYLQDLMVTHTARRSGVGRKLMDAVRNFARERQILRIQLPVLARNEDAISFYRAMGFDTVILGMEQDLSSDAEK